MSTQTGGIETQHPLLRSLCTCKRWDWQHVCHAFGWVHECTHLVR